MKKFCDLNWAVQAIAGFEAMYGTRMPRSQLVRLVRSTYLGGRPTSPTELLKQLTQLDLTELDGDTNLVLTFWGFRFLQAGQPDSYELSVHQKRVLALLWMERHQQLAHDWMAWRAVQGDVNAGNIRQVPIDLRQFAQEARYLEFVDEDGSIRAEFTASLLPSPPGMTLDELLVRLQKEQELGAWAEQVVVAFERDRLGEIGWHEQAQGVRQISGEIVNAGYDVLSYSSPVAETDRFIEVKYIGHRQRYFWSANEVRVAHLLGDRYFLYLVSGTQVDPSVWMIQNPAQTLANVGAQMKPVQYQVNLDLEQWFLDATPDNNDGVIQHARVRGG